MVWPERGDAAARALKAVPDLPAPDEGNLRDQLTEAAHLSGQSVLAAHKRARNCAELVVVAAVVAAVRALPHGERTALAKALLKVHSA